MPSRYEQRPTRTGDVARRITLVPVNRVEPKPTRLVQEGHEPSEDERPWQALVRKLRQLIATNDPPVDDRREDIRPYLRVLPGGKVDHSDEPPTTTITSRGKWH